MVFCGLMLTGCDIKDVLDNYVQAIVDEGQYNSDCVDKLVQTGIIDKGFGETLKKHIDRTVAEYSAVTHVGDFQGKSRDSVKWVLGEKGLAKAVEDRYNAYYGSFYVDENGKAGFRLPEPKFSKIKTLLDATINVKSYEEWKNSTDGEFVKVSIGKPEVKAKNVPDAIPYLAMSEKNVAYFESKSTLPVYVLKSTAYSDSNNDKYQDKTWYDKKYGDTSYTDYASMDRLLQAIEGLKKNENTVENERILREYFTDSGTTLASKQKFIEEGELTFTSDGIESLRLAVIRFDMDAIEAVYGNLENKEGKYFVYNNVAYLLEYPVYYLQNIKATTDGGENWEMNIKKTDMRVNFYSGELLDKNGKALKQKDGTDAIYHVDPSTGSSSFMFGTELVTYSNIGYNKIEVNDCLQILLRDYLELIYLPGVVKNESFVALGRRIRIDNTKGGLSTPVGHFIDKRGNAVGDTKVMATDLMSILSGQSGSRLARLDYTNTKIKVALKYKEDTFDDTDTTVGSDTSNSGLIENTELLINTKYQKDLRVVFELPWKGMIGFNNIAGEDINNTSKTGPQLYGLATDINLFDSGLYESWVNVSGDGGEVGNLEWWNNWLSANNYSYQVIMGNLKDALGQNYSYELAKEGNIILDLNTISNIQKQYDREAEINRVTGVRTAFLVVGTILIGYSLLIPAAWLYDTNVTNGPRLLTKLSFGNWIAVANSDEIPTMGVGSKQYFNFGAVMVKAIIICGIGVLLHLVDFVEIVGLVWQLFGALVQKIKEAVFNLF